MRGGLSARISGAGRPRHQRFHHGDIIDRLLAQRGQKRVFILQFQSLQRGLQCAFTQRGGQTRDDVLVKLAAKRDMLLALLLPDEAPDGRPRLAGKDKGLPAGVGMLGLGPEYLYLITVLDLRPEIGRASCRERVWQYV